MGDYKSSFIITNETLSYVSSVSTYEEIGKHKKVTGTRNYR